MSTPASACTSRQPFPVLPSLRRVQGSDHSVRGLAGARNGLNPHPRELARLRLGPHVALSAQPPRGCRRLTSPTAHPDTDRVGADRWLDPALSCDIVMKGGI